KKQTVWLLTMLSLMIVLSVYYMMSDRGDLAYIHTEDEAGQFNFEIDEPNLNEVTDNEVTDEDVDVEDITTLGMSEMFATLRMEIDDERSLQKERLQDIIASSESSTVDINDAMNNISELDKVAMKEKILQETILTTYEHYKDVLVRAEDDKVHVHVITKELPRTEAIEMMQMIRDELGEVAVDIHFQEK